MGLLGHSRNTFYGHLPGGEIFNVSLWFDTAPSSQSAAQTQATNFAAAFAANITTPPASSVAPTTYMYSSSGWDGVRVYSYTTDGPAATYIADAPISKPGTSTSAGILPLQCAIVVTLKTAVAGRSATGRIYMPAPGATLQSSNNQLGSSDCSAIATWWSKTITALNAAAGTGHVCVYSHKLGTSQSVNAVTVDSKIDIQRRRANKEVPATKSTVVVT